MSYRHGTIRLFSDPGLSYKSVMTIDKASQRVRNHPGPTSREGHFCFKKDLLCSPKAGVAGAFASDPMEQSKPGYYADFVLYPLLIMGLGVFETGRVHKVPYLWLCSLALGLLMWTIVEYGAHRFILHSVEAFSRLHEHHHAMPGAYVGTPTWISLLCFALAGFAPALILFGWDVAGGVTTGLTLGYLWYLVVHDAVHRRHLKRGSLLYRAKMHHALHHYAKARGNYGVSSPFWDYFFGTYITPAPWRSTTAVGEGTLDVGTDNR